MGTDVLVCESCEMSYFFAMKSYPTPPSCKWCSKEMFWLPRLNKLQQAEIREALAKRKTGQEEKTQKESI